MLDYLGCYDAFKGVKCCGEISYCPLTTIGEPYHPWLKDSAKTFYKHSKDLSVFLSMFIR